MPYKIAFISLGCAKNLVNTEQMMALCRAAGHTVTGDPEGADVAVLNTCGFIESAKSEAIDHIIQLGELKKAGKLKKLLVAGCLSQRYPGDIRAELPEADGLLGTGSYTDVVRAVEALMAGERPEYFSDIHRTYEDGERLVTTPPYTAYLKIAEGCSNGCAFCIIPKLRGKYRSRSVEALLAEAEKLAASGVKELIVIAQDITRYGLDLPEKTSLAALLRELCKLDFHWIRLHYLYPEAITGELIDVIASEPKVLHYLDIPIQHCNDGILKAVLLLFADFPRKHLYTFLKLSYRIILIIILMLNLHQGLNLYQLSNWRRQITNISSPMQYHMDHHSVPTDIVSYLPLIAPLLQIHPQEYLY